MRFLYGVLFGFIAALIVAELVLQVLPVSTSTKTGYYLTPSIISYPPHHQFVIATGWNLSNAQHHQSNNYGFLTQRDFLPNTHAIGLIGDSFVEANMLKEDDRLNSQLEKKLDNRPVYAFGGPGSSLLDYSDRARFAQEHLGIHDFVFIIELGDVRQTLCGSGNVHGPCLDPVTLLPGSDAQPMNVSAAKKLLRQSALAQYLFSQLRLKPEGLIKKLFGNANPAQPNSSASPSHQLVDQENVKSASVDHIVSTFLSSLPQNKDGRIVLVFDSYRDYLTDTNPTQTPVRDRFIQLARQAGIDVIDTESIFYDFWHKTGLSLNVSPSDKHWNRLTNDLVADVVASKFRHPSLRTVIKGLSSAKNLDSAIID